MPLISVLMGIYNCESTLEEAVACIQAQTISDWELILCDDGSADNTYQLACHLAERDSRIVILRNEQNMGLAATLNHCLQAAQGEYVARMDGDDVCPPQRFAEELGFLQSNPEYALVSGWMECFDEQGKYGTVQYMEKPAFGDLVRTSQFCHAACMMRREVLVALGGYRTLPETTRVEDYDLWVRLYQAGHRGYNLQQVMYSMRDDRNAFRRRKLQYRVNEAKVSLRAIKGSGASIGAVRYPLMIVCKGLIPGFVYGYLHRRKVGG